MYRTKRQLDKLEASFSARFDLVDKVCSELESLMDDVGMTDSDFNALIGVREALINAVSHGAKENPLEEVCLFASLDKDNMLIRIKDPGDGFNWKEVIGTTESRLSKQKNLIPERGRGISILLHYFDSVSFNEKGNEVEMHLAVDKQN